MRTYNAKFIKQYGDILGTENHFRDIAGMLFKNHKRRQTQIFEEAWRCYDQVAAIEEAKRTLAEWEEKSGRQQNYTPKELAAANVFLDVRIHYDDAWGVELMETNLLHDAIVRYTVKEHLGAKLIEQGKDGKKLAVVELAARLSPALNFPGSSAYLTSVVIPYGIESRVALGENQQGSLVSREAVEESARAAKELFGVERILAETSSAPTNRINKSRRAPQLYISSIDGNKSDSEDHIIDTPFRDEFDATVRELMFMHLKRMYER